jgi:hypothetical protein
MSGADNQPISFSLGVGLPTAKTHMVHIFDKLGVDSRLAAVATLEAIVGRPVDLVQLRAVRNRHLRYYIEKGKSPVYVAACPRRVPGRHRALRRRGDTLKTR